MLETKIEELTKAVERLTVAILERDINEIAKSLIAQNVDVKALVEAPAKAVEAKAEKVEQVTPEPEQTQVTYTDVQDAVLAKVRDVSGAKPKVKELLKSYNAMKVNDLAESALTEFLDKVNAL